MATRCATQYLLTLNETEADILSHVLESVAENRFAPVSAIAELVLWEILGKLNELRDK